MSVDLVPADDPQFGSPIGPRGIRRIVIAVFVLGIGGMIAGSILDNNRVNKF